MRVPDLFSITLGAVCLWGGAPGAFGQHFSIGVTGGFGLTDALQNQTIQYPIPLSYSSGSKDYVVGPMVELGFPLNLSLELDGLYRPLNGTVVLLNSTGSSLATINFTPLSHGSFHCWRNTRLLFPSRSHSLNWARLFVPLGT